MRPPRSSNEGFERGLPAAFHVFWVGQGLSALGDAMTVVALPLVVLAQTGSVTDMGRLNALARAGGLVATALAGTAVDRAGPRRIMIACDALRCMLMALVPLAASFGFTSLGLLFAVGVGAALGQGVFYVGHVALMVQLVGKQRVGVANSRVEGTIALAYVFGPLLAGLLSTRLGPVSVLGIDAATFAISVLTLAAVVRSGTDAPAPVSLSAEPGFAGLRFIRSSAALARLTVLVAVANFFTAAIVDLFIFRLKHELRQGDTAAGITFAIAAAASVLTALGTPWLRAQVRFHRLWIAGVIVQGLALCMAWQARSLALLVTAAALYMGAQMMLLICQASIRQELAPERLLGRVTSWYLVLVALPMPLGALFATTAAARYGVTTVFSALGVGLLTTAAGAIWLFSRPGLEWRAEPAPPS